MKVDSKEKTGVPTAPVINTMMTKPKPAGDCIFVECAYCRKINDYGPDFCEACGETL